VSILLKDVLGYEGLYQVDTEGNVFNRHGRKMKPCKQNRGYLILGLHKDNKTQVHTVHRLVAETFLGVAPKGYEINHKDGDKTNNRVSNLEWVTHAENMEHAFTTGKRRYTPIDMFSLTGEYIRTFKSLTLAAKFIGASKSQICECAQGIVRSAHGYVWRYSERMCDYGMDRTESTDYSHYG
jgi:hypothetical protein